MYLSSQWQCLDKRPEVKVNNDRNKRQRNNAKRLSLNTFFRSSKRTEVLMCYSDVLRRVLKRC